MTPSCGSTIDFYNNGVLYACDRDPDHTGRHAHRGTDAILTWS